MLHIQEESSVPWPETSGLNFERARPPCSSSFQMFPIKCPPGDWPPPTPFTAHPRGPQTAVRAGARSLSWAPFLQTVARGHSPCHIKKQNFQSKHVINDKKNICSSELSHRKMKFDWNYLWINCPLFGRAILSHLNTLPHSTHSKYQDISFIHTPKASISIIMKLFMESLQRVWLSCEFFQFFSMFITMEIYRENVDKMERHLYLHADTINKSWKKEMLRTCVSLILSRTFSTDGPHPAFWVSLCLQLKSATGS